MNKRVVRRLLETFFRRWYLYLVPLVAFTAVGVYKASGTTSGYKSTGIVDVSNGTLLSELTSIRGENYGYDTPAASTAGTINGLLGTGQFTTEVATRAGVTTALQRGQLTYLGLREAIYATAADDNLLKVVSITANPELSARLAKATIDAYIDYVVAGDVAESAAAEQFFEGQLATNEEQLANAQAALDQYFVDHPGGNFDERPPAEQAAIEQLQLAVGQARDKVTATEAKIDEARLATEQATHDVQQRLRIVDEPEIALAPEPRLKQAVMTTGMFMFVGLLVSLAAIVLATVIDRSLWTADDIEHLFQVPVLAAIPVAKMRGRRRSAVAERAPFTSVASPMGRARVGLSGFSGAVVVASSTRKVRSEPRAPREQRQTIEASEATR
jgi:uncharacterized protein involved in exopolysaccharide biosynthesis